MAADAAPIASVAAARVVGSHTVSPEWLIGWKAERGGLALRFSHELASDAETELAEDGIDHPSEHVFGPYREPVPLRLSARIRAADERGSETHNAASEGVVELPITS